MLVYVPEQIVVVPEIVAVGKALTVIATEPVWFWLQFEAPFKATLTKS